MAIVHDVHARWRVPNVPRLKKRFIAFFFAAHRVKRFYRLFTHTDMVNTSLFYIL